MELDPQHVIASLRRQLSEAQWQLALAEAQIVQTQENEGERLGRSPRLEDIEPMETSEVVNDG